jgi:hypothetical protein
MLAARTIVLAVLAGFFLSAATEHARLVNTSKARGDQSGYLWDAQQVYWNWQGRSPQKLIGERNRMPLYAAYLALFYSPDISDDDYFIVAKRWNIRLAVVLIAALAVIFARRLPSLLSFNLTLIVAFGYFVFKAGYAQSELLFYFLFFLTFLAFWSLLERPPGLGSAIVAAAAGALAALAHLTKAALLPFVAIFVAVYAGREIAAYVRSRSVSQTKSLSAMAAGFAVPALVVVVLLAVLAPYLANSKRVFGHYFYNVNTTFYAWYDNWGAASVGTLSHGDGVGWPTLPDDQIPSVSKYWRTHTLGQIAARISGGFEDMLVRSYHTYSYLKYVVWYVALMILTGVSNLSGVRGLVRRHAALAAFLVLYGASHLVLIAFYAPISGTGTTRFLIAHLTPFFYAASAYLASPAIADTQWTVAGVAVTLRHLHILTLVMLALDITFWIWPRLMTTYGGF